MESGKKMSISGGCATDIGIARKVNQDAVFFQVLYQQEECFAAGAVCDGIGGMQAGEEASALVINGIRQWFAQVCGWIDIPKAEPGVLFAHLKDAAEQWNRDVMEFSRKRQIKSGTTMSLIMILRNRFYILHAGDSRIYRYHYYLEQLTSDDTITAFSRGKEKTYLENYLGKSEQLRFASACGELKRGDVFLFCSDGFYHKLREADIQAYVSDCKKKLPLELVCQKAVRQMEERGETDNISVGLIIAGSLESRIFSF